MDIKRRMAKRVAFRFITSSSQMPTENVQYHWDRGQGTSGFHTIIEESGEPAPSTKQEKAFDDNSIHDVEFADDRAKKPRDGDGRQDAKDFTNLQLQFNKPEVPDNVRR